MGNLRLTDEKLNIEKLRSKFLIDSHDLIKNHEIIEWFFPIHGSGKRPLSNKELNV
jgi:hypothetical protein